MPYRKPHKVSPKRKNQGSGLILALDPSPNNTGVVVLNFNDLNVKAHTPLLIKTIDLEAKAWGLVTKATYQANYIKDVMRKHPIEAIACEAVAHVSYGAGNAYKTMESMVKLEGMIQFLGKANKVPVRLFPPGTWRSKFRIAGDNLKAQARAVAADLTTVHITQWSEHAAEACLVGLFYAETYATSELRQMRIF